MAIETWIADFNKCLDAWDGKYIITSPDIDGFLSAAAICHHRRNELNPPEIIGIYTARHIVLFDNHSLDDAKNAIWLDHDITHNEVLCLGQHLLRLQPSDTINRRHQDSFNPNMWYQGLAYSNCFNGLNAQGIDKFPFATIHYIMAGLNIPEPSQGTTGYSLLAHADSAWASGYNYNPNCKIWKDEMFDDTHRVVNDITSQNYCNPENRSIHHRMVRSLLAMGIKAASSATRQRPNIPEVWRVIQGNQTLSFAKNTNWDAWMDKFQNLWDYILTNMNWIANSPSFVSSITSGDYNRDYPDRIHDLGDLLEAKQVFSHAVTSNSEIKYTTGINL